MDTTEWPRYYRHAQFVFARFYREISAGQFEYWRPTERIWIRVSPHGFEGVASLIPATAAEIGEMEPLAVPLDA